MDVLVTGGAGFIGSHVCRSLRSNGSGGRVLVLDDFSTGLESNLDGIENVEVHRGSVLDESLVSDLVSEVDAVVHLAAVPAVARSLQNPRGSHDANATGTVVVLEAVRHHSRYVIVASSSSVYGRNAVAANFRGPSDQAGQPICRQQAGRRVLHDVLHAVL